MVVDNPVYPCCSETFRYGIAWDLSGDGRRPVLCADDGVDGAEGASDAHQFAVQNSDLKLFVWKVVTRENGGDTHSIIVHRSAMARGRGGTICGKLCREAAQTGYLADSG